MTTLKKSKAKFFQTTEFLSLLLALCVVLLIAVLSYRSWFAFRASSADVEGTQKMIDGTEQLLSLLKDAESGQRGFLLTGEDRYLAPYREALLRIPAALNTLDLVAKQRPDQARRLRALALLVRRKLDELSLTIQVRQSKGQAAAVAIVLDDSGKILMEQVRQLCFEIRAAAFERLARYSAESRASAKQLELIGTLGSLAIFALLVLSTINIQRAANRRQELIHSLRESESRTAEARDWFHTTIASIADGVIATDPMGKISFMNRAAESLTGWTQEQAVGSPLEQIFLIHDEETGETTENPLSQALREGRVAGLESQVSLRNREGRPIPIRNSAAPIRRTSGSIAGAVMVFRDISQEREAERHKKKAADDLARHSALLERKNAELEQFAYATSHDLREPLRTISAYTELLRRDAISVLSEKAAGYLLSVTAAVRRMDQLIEALLHYSKAGELDGEDLQSVRIEEVVNHTIENLNGSITETRAEVTHDGLPAITGNEIHMEQLFQNLISNALKYRRETPPRIRIAAYKHAGEWLFSVSDNGQGIPPEYRAQIFGLFKRLHRQDHSGSGIGLATCKKIVERYGGRIWVDSELGKGSTFFFTLPEVAQLSQSTKASGAAY
jgi:PAS domain S-box-containing protein